MSNYPDSSDNGIWRRGTETVQVIARPEGGIRMIGDTWWTCCDSETWKVWKSSHGYTRINSALEKEEGK